MRSRFSRLAIITIVLVAGLYLNLNGRGQDTRAVPEQQPAAGAAPAQDGSLPAVPTGVEVLARGPVHEAFAAPTTDPVPTNPVPKEPPKPLDEMPPVEKPEGNVTWITGYWAWDDDKKDFLWVSGTWRVPPPGKKWVAGYWKQESNAWQWVPGFWTPDASQQAAGQQVAAQDVTYLPAPPAPPETAPPGEPPAPESFYVPGHWEYRDAGYVTAGGGQVWREAGYRWSAGYWARVQPGYVWVPAHYRWTPTGYIFIPGYWDLAVADRGFLYAPVYVDYAVVGPTFVYTPAYCVRDTIVLDAMFVRPCYCHYYFGDYYGPAYHDLGFESVVVFGRSHYDAVFVYERYEHRYEPSWATVQVDLYLGRSAGRYPVPPRTLVQQNTIVQNNITNVTNVTNVNNTTINKNQVLMPTSQLAAAKGVRTVPLDASARQQAQQQASAIQQVAAQRSRTELPSAPGKPIQPRAATLNVPPTRPVTSRLEAASGTRPATGMVKTNTAAQPGAAGASLRAPATATNAKQPAGSNRPAGLSGPPGSAAPGANSLHPGTGTQTNTQQHATNPAAAQRPPTQLQKTLPFGAKTPPRMPPRRPDPPKRPPDQKGP